MELKNDFGGDAARTPLTVNDKQPGFRDVHKRGVCCIQPEAEFVRAAAALREQLPNASLFFLGIAGKLETTEGAFVLRFRATAAQYAGIALFLKNTHFTCNEAKDLDPQVKFFIDGIEKTLKLPVLLVGCPGSPRHVETRWILNENRWPQQEAETTETTISSQESEEQ